MMGDTSPRLQQVIYDEVVGDLKVIVDRLDEISKTLPPVASDFDASVKSATEELQRQIIGLMSAIAQYEIQIRKKVDYNANFASKIAIEGIKTGINDFVKNSLGDMIQREIRPIILKNLRDGEESLQATQQSMLETKKSLSINARATQIIIVASVLVGLVVGMLITTADTKKNGIGQTDSTAIERDAHFLEELWPLLPPEKQQELIKIHDRGESSKSK